MSKPQLNQCPPTGNSGFAEGFLTGPRHRRTHGTKSFADGRDPRQNHLFAESQPSARIAPSEKERAPSHLGCRPLCRRLRREAVGTDATCAESPSKVLGKGVDPRLTRLTGLCQEPAGAVGR
jgi:hypothetical protein